MKKTYFYHSRKDKKKEKLGSITIESRLQAALAFAERKQLDLKSFLTIYAVSR